MKIASKKTASKKAAAAALVLALGGAALVAESSYAKVEDGIGNILMGEVLPYDDDDGYRNPVLDSVKLSEFASWDSLYFRAYLDRTVGEIEHDIRVLVFRLDPKGKKVDQFRRDVGDVLVLATGRKGEPADYGERTEWARAFPGFNTLIPLSPQAVKMGSFLRAYDPEDPESFAYRELERDFGNDVVFNAMTFKIWKKKYGLTSIDFDVKLFTFVDGGEITTGENKTVLVVGDGKVEEKEELASVATFTSWDDRQYLASGKFTIVLD